MEIKMVLFKPNEIKLDLFTHGTLFKYIYYNNPCELKNKLLGNYEEIDNTKMKLEKYNHLDYIRRAATKYYNDYELVKVLCKKPVISRAYFKIYELLYFEEILNKPTLNCVFLCEAPGGFIDAILDIRRKKNLTIEYLSLSKNDTIIYDKYINKDCLIFGDITLLNIINHTINTSKEKFKEGVDLITADGGFDIKKYNSQEILVFKLLLSEIIIALSIQKESGIFVIKFFDMFTHNSIVLYLILCVFYKEVKIIKPLTSRNSNSERYLVCKDFIKITDNELSFINKLKNVITKILITDNIYTTLFPDVVFNDKIYKIKEINNLISNIQINSINNSVKLVNEKHIYFNQLLIRLFSGNFKINNLICFNNILKSRIKNSIGLLKKYNINTISINY
jgi:23S rRNA U2552 (ribose-2'-O)-methylase RlmE/FtsJ